MIIATIEGGRSPRTLVLDAIFTDGTVGLVSAGPRLEMWARWNSSEPNPYGDLWAAHRSHRVADGAA